MNLRQYKTAQERREALAKELSVDVKHIGSFTLDESVASTRNCENMIGVAQIPMGVAGPLNIANQPVNEETNKGESKEYYVPLATTEGALIASVNRGCKAIGASGGATVVVEEVGVTRGPVFRVSGASDGVAFMRWLEEHREELNQVAKTTSTHIALLRITPRMIGRNVFVRFAFDTTDAMGMNMATIATTAMVGVIEAKTGAHCVAVAGNFDIDKKPGWLSVYEGRGKRVWAEAHIPSAVLMDVLKTTAKEVREVYERKTVMGSLMAGSLGYNNHAANIVAALYLATGQDAAHVIEGSLTTTTVELLDPDALYIAVMMPAVLVGTIGGGTGLATQKEALSVIGAKDPRELAAVVAASVLAGELSLLASLANNTLACAHESLARGKRMKKSTNDKPTNSELAD